MLIKKIELFLKSLNKKLEIKTSEQQIHELKCALENSSNKIEEYKNTLKVKNIEKLQIEEILESEKKIYSERINFIKNEKLKNENLLKERIENLTKDKKKLEALNKVAIDEKCSALSEIERLKNLKNKVFYDDAFDSNKGEMVDLINKNIELSSKVKNLEEKNSIDLGKIEDLNTQISLLQLDLNNSFEHIRRKVSIKAMNINSEESADKSSTEKLKLENKFLTNYLIQQEHLVQETFSKKIKLEKLCSNYADRWARLMKRMPDYTDFGVLEILEFDHHGDQPSITWSMKECQKKDGLLPNFIFKITLKEGIPGIGLVEKEDLPCLYLFPKEVLSTQIQLNQFLSISNVCYQQLSAAVELFKYLDKDEGAGIKMPLNFDITFWKSPLRQLMNEWAVLPATLRYNKIKLKRELINSDYEQLWIELHEASYKNQLWPKLEFRVGAALIQSDGFSLYPKFEFPLIDGKYKPFTSWYAESHDDFGAKYELRFSLEKNIFDVTTFQKITKDDQKFILNLIQITPSILNKLKIQGISVHRNWDVWIDFVSRAIGVISLAYKTVNENKKKIDNDNVDKFFKKDNETLLRNETSIKHTEKTIITVSSKKNIAQKKVMKDRNKK
jgi:hypothetical protein